MKDKRLYQPQYIREILEQYGFTFSKALGQNFLIDGNVVRNIAEGAEVSKEDIILEVGPGIGTLTEELAMRAKKVFCVEKDSRLIPILKETLKDFDNIRFINEDILKFDWDSFMEEHTEGKRIKIVANLPYYITTPIIESILKRADRVESITVMVQKEVAERMVATEKDSNYGSLSLFIRYFSEAKIIAKVPNHVFMPKPDVDSAVIRLTTRNLNYPGDEEFLFGLIRSGFVKRRKTILNSLTKGFVQVDKKNLREVLEELSISEKSRAENLSMDDFMNIALLLERGRTI